jgi:Transposase IS66 family
VAKRHRAEHVPESLASHSHEQLAAIIEAQAAVIRGLQELVQQLRDEVARLKGEQGRPQVRPQARQDRSSERERPKEAAPSTSPPPAPAPLVPVVQREEIVRLDRASLPSTAEHAGYEDYTVQEVVLQAEVVCYRREAFRDPTTGARWVAPLPTGITDHFGPQVKAFALDLYAVGGMSEPAILTLLQAVGLHLSAGTLSTWLVADLAPLHAEAAAIYLAGLASAPFAQIDDTLTRLNGENHHCQVVCNPCYTSYHTTPTKDRLAIVDVLRPGQEGTYWCDGTALAWLAQVGVSATVRREVLACLPQETLLDHPHLRDLLDARLGHLGSQTRSRVFDALAIAAYHHQTAIPVVELLLSDEAGQFVGVTDEHALCWVHDARHYKRLIPLTWEHQALWTIFRHLYWAFYAALLVYRTQPTPQDATRLRAWFLALFSTVTGYAALDERIAKTLAHQRELLAVLDHPEIPLHNNACELGVRRRVRKRDVSFGPRTAAGAKTWDTLHTLAATAQLHGVNVLHYLQDRLSGACRFPSLASLVTARAAHLDLGNSWRAGLAHDL